MVSINTNLQSLIVQQNLQKSTNALNLAIERMTTGFKINGAKDNAANYSIAGSYDSKLSAYEVAQDNAAMGADMLSYADDILSNMTSNATRLRELCVQAQNGTYGKQSVQAIKTEAKAIVSQISNLYRTAEYNGIKIFDIYSDRLEELQTNSDTPETTIGLTTEINPDYDGFIANPYTYTDAEVEAMTSLSTVRETDTISSGTYKITSKDELKQLATMTNSGKITSNSVTFVLGADIDLRGEEWTAIGEYVSEEDTSKQFRGTFDGNGHTVSGLYINKSEDNQGLFGCTASDSTIKNVGVVNANVNGKSRAGALAWYAIGNITNCYAEGNVSGTNNVGGLVGRSNTAISNSYANVNVTGTYIHAGGLVGIASSNITNSYATGSVQGYKGVGGIVGNAQGSITNCYATGNVSGSLYAGGLAGYAQSSILNCFTTGNVASTSNDHGYGMTGGMIGCILKTSGSMTLKNNASFGKVSAKYEACSGSFIGGIANTTNGTKFSNITITNCITNSTDKFDLIGGTCKCVSSTYTAIDEPAEFMETWSSNISTFNSTTSLQVGINRDSSCQINMKNDLNIGLLKQLETLDVSSSSSLEFMDSFLEALSAKSTEIGAYTNRVMSALDSISVSIESLTSSRSTIKDADIAKESSAYIRAQILQQASATLLATANQSPAIALQLI